MTSVRHEQHDIKKKIKNRGNTRLRKVFKKVLQYTVLSLIFLEGSNPPSVTYRWLNLMEILAFFSVKGDTATNLARATES